MIRVNVALRSLLGFCSMKQWWGTPGDKRTGGVREAGVEGEYFASKKRKEAGTNKYREGTGFKGYGERQV